MVVLLSPGDSILSRRIQYRLTDWSIRTDCERIFDIALGSAGIGGAGYATRSKRFALSLHTIETFGTGLQNPSRSVVPESAERVMQPAPNVLPYLCTLLKRSGRVYKTRPAQDLLLADRYYCTFAIIALLQAQGIPVLFPLHANKKADFRLGSKLGAKDHLVEWKKPQRKPVWMTTLAYADLPELVTVREFKVKGIVYVTTLLNAKQFNKQELANLYKERWKIELDFLAIKTHMGMEMLRCKTPEMVQKEIAVHLLAYNIIRGNLAQAAVLHNKIPRQLSFRSAVQLVCQAAKQLVVLTGKRLAHALLALVKAMTSTSIGLQKRKNQPRAIKRRPKPFPLLTVPRHEACLSL